MTTRGVMKRLACIEQSAGFGQIRVGFACNDKVACPSPRRMAFPQTRRMRTKRKILAEHSRETPRKPADPHHKRGDQRFPHLSVVSFFSHSSFRLGHPSLLLKEIGLPESTSEPVSPTLLYGSARGGHGRPHSLWHSLCLALSRWLGIGHFRRNATFSNAPMKCFLAAASFTCCFTFRFQQAQHATPAPA